MTIKQITKKLEAAGIKTEGLEISRDCVDVWAGDKSIRIARKVAKTLGWSSISSNGSHAWTQPTSVDMGEYNNPSSRWHY